MHRPLDPNTGQPLPLDKGGKPIYPKPSEPGKPSKPAKDDPKKPADADKAKEN